MRIFLRLLLNLNLWVKLSLVPIYFLSLIGAVRGDNVLTADGVGQNLMSEDKTYSTSTSRPAILAIRGGTIFSIDDRIALLPPGGLTALRAEGLGSQITAQNPIITAVEPSQIGISGAKGLDGGRVTINGGRIEILGDRSFGVIDDNGTVTAKGALSISMAGVDSHGVEARGIGSVELNPNVTITMSGAGGAGIFALAGGKVTANGITIATSGLLASDGFDADGAAALGGTIKLENSSISTSGPGANGLLTSGPGSSITVTNSNILSSNGSGALVDNGARLTLFNSSLTAFLHGIVAIHGTVAEPNSIYRQRWEPHYRIG